MKWILGWTVCIYVIVNLPLFFLLASQAARSTLPTLWGYSPHQFFFCAIVFPFACFASLTSLYVLVTRMGPDWPEGLRGYPLLQNWPAALLVALCLSSLVTLVDYFSSARSLDKLSPSISRIATQALQRIQDEVENAPRKQKQEVLDDLIEKAIKAKRDLQPPRLKGSEEAARWLQGLPPELVLQIVGDASLQRQLRLLDSTLYPLSILQVFVSVFVGVIALFSSAICFHLIHNVQPSAAAWEARNAVFNAVFFFGFYSICYQQYRNEIESYGISGSTTLQQLFVGGLVAILLVVLATLDISKEHIGPQFVASFAVPFLVFIIGVGAEVRGSQLLRSLLGAKTNLGIQCFLALVIILFGIFVGLQIWPTTPASTPPIKP